MAWLSKPFYLYNAEWVRFIRNIMAERAFYLRFQTEHMIVRFPLPQEIVGIYLDQSIAEPAHNGGSNL